MSMLDVTLGVNTAALQTGLDRARGQVRQFASATAVTMAAAFVVTAMINFFSSLTEKFDRVQKLAERFGASAESIQRIAFAAEQSGTEIEGLAGSLQKASRNADAAARGNSDLEESFARLGIKARAFIDMTPEEKLLALSSGFTGIGSAGERVNLALEIMGKSGGEALPLLLQGSEALKEQMDGVVVASQASVDAIARTNDAIDRMKTNLFAMLAPVIGVFEVLGGSVATVFNGIVAGVTLNLIGLSAVAKEVFSGNFKAAAQEAENWKANTLANIGEVVNKLAELNSKGAALFTPEAPGGGRGQGLPDGPNDSEPAGQSQENDKAAGKAAESRAVRIGRLKEEIYQKEKADAEEKLALGDKILLAETQIASARQIAADASDEELRLSKIAEALDLEKQLGTLKQQQAEKLATAEEASRKTAEEQASNRLRQDEQVQRDAEASAHKAAYSGNTGLGGISSLAAIGGGGNVGEGNALARVLNETQRQTKVLEEIAKQGRERPQPPTA